LILLIAREYDPKDSRSLCLQQERSKRFLSLVFQKSFEGVMFSATTGAAPGVHIDPLQLRITLTINNDVVIDDDVADMYATSTGGFTGGWPYFIPIPRRLTGQDTIILRVTNSSGASQILNCTIWYRNEI
jgi:hypothetical protein